MDAKEARELREKQGIKSLYEKTIEDPKRKAATDKMVKELGKESKDFFQE